LYIGKTETMGKRNGNLSVNITNLTRDKSKFARWGDNYAYHIGDLSAVAVKGYPDDKKTIKYKAWAESLFKKFPASNPELKEEVFFGPSLGRRMMWEYGRSLVALGLLSLSIC